MAWPPARCPRCPSSRGTAAAGRAGASAASQPTSDSMKPSAARFRRLRNDAPLASRGADRDHRRRAPSRCWRATRSPRIACGWSSPAPIAAPLAAARRTGRVHLLTVGHAEPGQGSRRAAAALAPRPRHRMAAHLRRQPHARPGHRRSCAGAEAAAWACRIACDSPVSCTAEALERAATRRRTSSCSPRGRRPTAWRWPRRWRGACRSSAPRTGAIPALVGRRCRPAGGTRRCRGACQRADSRDGAMSAPAAGWRRARPRTASRSAVVAQRRPAALARPWRAEHVMDEALAHWLRLREAHGLGLAQSAVSRATRAHARRRDASCILDFGTGTGSNLRYLVERSAAAAGWLLVDRSRRSAVARLSTVRPRGPGTRACGWSANAGRLRAAKAMASIASSRLGRWI